MKRRTFLASTLAAGTAAALYAWKIEPHWLEFSRHDLPVRGLPPSLEGKTVVQLSDLHVGPTVDDSYLVHTFRRVSALRPDIVVITGDFISYYTPVFDQLRRLVAEFPRGRLATVGVFGNHDYGPNWAHPEIAKELRALLAPHGVDMLRNAAVDVQGLYVMGLDDLWGGSFDAAAGVTALKPGRAAIALSHNPDTVDLPGWAGFEGWILSGHTHGGQCKPPFLPPPLLPVKNRRYVSGAYDLTGDRQLFISRGVGHLMEVRFNVRPEVPVFTLREA